MMLSFYDAFQVIKTRKTHATINFNGLLHVNIILFIKYHVIIAVESKFYQLQDWPVTMGPN